MINAVAANTPLAQFDSALTNNAKTVSAPNEAREYYDSVKKHDIGIDLEPYIAIDEAQIKTNKEASSILDKNIDNFEEWADFQVHCNMLLDTFKQNSPISEMIKKTAEYFNRTKPIYDEMIANLKDLLIHKTISHDIYRANMSYLTSSINSDDEYKHEPKIFYYGQYRWQTPEERQTRLMSEKVQEFINLYQLNEEFVQSDKFNEAFNRYINNFSGEVGFYQIYNHDKTEFIKAQVAQYGMNKTEWLELFEDNVKILREHVFRDDFASRPPLAKQMLTRQLELAESILKDANDLWTIGSRLDLVI
jgi:hypothetical protein